MGFREDLEAEWNDEWNRDTQKLEEEYKDRMKNPYLDDLGMSEKDF